MLANPQSIFAALFAATLISSAAAPSSAAPKFDNNSKAGTNTDWLTEGLDELLELEPAPRLPGAEPAKPSQGNPLRKKPAGDRPLDLRHRGKPISPPAGDDVGGPSPLARITDGMDESQQLIERLDTTGTTGKVQRQVIADLDELIRQAEKQCQNCQGGGKPKPGEKQQSQRSKPKPSAKKTAGKKPGDKPSQQAAQQSSVRLGAAEGEVDPKQFSAEAMKKVWGTLPQRLREQMLESSTDQFLPEYREEIEQYFKKLAEEPAE